MARLGNGLAPLPTVRRAGQGLFGGRGRIGRLHGGSFREQHRERAPGVGADGGDSVSDAPEDVQPQTSQLVEVGLSRPLRALSMPAASAQHVPRRSRGKVGPHRERPRANRASGFAEPRTSPRTDVDRRPRARDAPPMRYLFGSLVLVSSLLLVACPPGHGSGSGSSGGPPPACSCDCPAGPPPCDVDAGKPCPLDAFCASAPDGAACCLGASVGACKAHECAPEPPAPAVSHGR